MKKLALLVCVAVISFSALSGCGNSQSATNSDTTKETEIASNEELPTDGISFIDDDGKEIVVDKPFEKLVVLYSAHAENLYTLGVGDKIIGVHSTCVYPPEAAFLPVFDYNGDPEAVIAANPDCVIIRPFISRRVPDFISAIESAGITVVSLYPDKFEDFDEYIGKLAMLTGSEEEAEVELEKFHGNLDEIKAITSAIIEDDRQKVFFEATEINYRTTTPDSMAGLAMDMAGGINVAIDVEAISEGGSIGSFGEERILELADEIDGYISQRGAMNSGGNEHSISIRPGFDTIKAVKEGRILLINEKIVSSPTFRYYKGVMEIARFLYPEIMNDISGYETEEIATKEDFAIMLTKAANIQIYIPSSSKYYQEEHKGHTYGLFEDVTWEHESFDYIETATISGAFDNEVINGKEYFNPDQPITRYMVAKAIFITSDLSGVENKTSILDLENCENKNIVQIVVDNNIMELNNGLFEPDKEVTCRELVGILEAL